jgi:Cu2+-exporting ATPase
MPSTAHMVHEDHIMDVNSESLKENDVILIKPGEKIAADGVIIR